MCGICEICFKLLSVPFNCQEHEGRRGTPENAQARVLLAANITPHRGDCRPQGGMLLLMGALGERSGGKQHWHKLLLIFFVIFTGGL